jgi:hypothetical protein
VALREFPPPNPATVSPRIAGVVQRIITALPGGGFYG